MLFRKKTEYTTDDKFLISNLKELVEYNERAYGDKILYHYLESDEVKKFTYRQVKSSVDELGTAFAISGLMGSNIAVIGDTHPHYMTAYYAAANGGGSIVPLDKELDNKAITGFIGIAEVKAVVYTASFNERMANISDELSDVKYFIPISPNERYMKDERFVALDDMLSRGRAALSGGNSAFIDYKVDNEAMAALLFTSGTTGTSKGVMLSHKNLAAATNSSCESMKFFREKDTFVSVLPMNHSYEVTCGHLALSHLGCTTYMNDSVKNALRSFNYFKPSALVLVPLYVETIHKRIWKEIDKKGIRRKVTLAMMLSDGLRKAKLDLRKKLFKDVNAAFGGNLKTIICGGAPLSREVIKDFTSFGIELLEGYGITECSPLVAVNLKGKTKLGSVGPPVKGCSVKIDVTSGDGTGEILVKGDNVMMGYYKNPEATAEVFTSDGWFRTGDIGYVDEDGYVFITGRKKNVIILSNGKNVFPEELEEHLSHNEIIAESVVVGRKNMMGEPVICALIYPDMELCHGKSKEEIYAAVKEAVMTINRHLPTFKHIQDIEIRENEFEKTTTRKIKRFLVS